MQVKRGWECTEDAILEGSYERRQTLDKPTASGVICRPHCLLIYTVSILGTAQHCVNMTAEPGTDAYVSSPKSVQWRERLLVGGAAPDQRPVLPLFMLLLSSQRQTGDLSP